MSRWDVVIVGAGLSGLSLGAVLAEKGKRVLILEKEGYLGGRATTTEFEGHVLDDGAHVPSRAGHIERVFELIGRPYPELAAFGIGEIYYNGKWMQLREVVPHEELREAFARVAAVPREEIDKLNDVPLDQWVRGFAKSEGIHLVFNYLATSTSVGNRYQNYSTGEMINVMREFMDHGKKLTEMAGVPKGGMKSIYEPLAESIVQKGGEVRLRTSAKMIVTAKGRVLGVAIEEGRRALHSQALPLKTVESDHVVCALPLWSLFKVLPKKGLPAWWVNWIDYLKDKTSQAWSVIYGLDEPAFDLSAFRWVPTMPKSGLSGIFFNMPTYGDKVGQYQFHISYQGHYCELPDLHNADLADNRREIEVQLDLLEEESAEFFPMIKGNVHWKVRHAGIYGIAQSPGLVGEKRPPIYVPEVEGLYIVGDCVREAVGIGMQSAVRSALVCAEAILGEKL